MTSIPMVLFEDPGWRRFGPLTTLRPVWRLRLGMDTLEGAISRAMDRSPDIYLPRVDLKPLLREEYGEVALQLPARGDVVLVNGRAADHLPREALDPKYPHAVWTDGPDIVAARLPVRVASELLTRPAFDPADYTAQALLNLWKRRKSAKPLRVIESEG
ncbi:MAG TPA: hypothetical protein ENI92_04445, partial [Bacteroidetes bacterium]|nr:hypothetical protein [Bacteroidota bacterium]